MIVESYTIPGGDLRLAGTASRSLKERLKKVGIEAGVLRRIMIVAYEAEMNVFIHARQGRMGVRLEDGKVDLEVTDEGPGIANVELAMKEGYSTAPPEARALGFGAGMGLPNMRRSSDRFEICSEVGRGTRVRATVYLRPEAASGWSRGAPQVRADRCRACLACLRACPTQALRVRPGGPRILEHRCIECTACLAACPAGALGIREGEAVGGPEAAGATVVLPAGLLVDLAPLAGPRRVLEGIVALGFDRVRLLEEWTLALREAARRQERLPKPVIVPVCPAVVNLIELRFPALIGHLAPFLSPIEAARNAYALREALFVVPCPACQGLLADAGAVSPVRTASPARFREALLPRLKDREGPAGGGEETGGGRQGGAWLAGAADLPGVLAAGGLDHAAAVLEALEEGRLQGAEALELTACPLGCYGSPLQREDAFIGGFRWRRFEAAGGLAEWLEGRAAGGLEGFHPESDPRAAAVRRMTPFAPRAGLRLDEDMTAAIEKLSRIDRLIRSLPGRDCGVCGAPTCAALAEDIVLGRARANDCPFAGGTP